MDPRAGAMAECSGFLLPWDSRTARDATVDDISETGVREHLREYGSALLDEPEARHITQNNRSSRFVTLGSKTSTLSE